MFECYLDDSGTTGLPIITMAGFIAPLSQWEELEPSLDAILSAHGVDVLHTKQFHDTKGPFDGWKQIRKHSFAEELFAATHGRLFGVSVAVRKRDIAQHQRENRDLVGMSPISICFSAIMTRIVSDPQIGPHVKDQGVAFLIESGNKNNAGIQQFFHKMQKQPMFEGCLRAISIIPKASCRAIQIADFLAFYSRRLLRNHDRFSGKVALPPCPYISIIKRHGPVWMHGGYGRPQTTDPGCGAT